MALERFSLGSSVNGPLGALVLRANELLALQSAVGKLLDESLKPHCRVAGLRAGVLTLSADSPVWATKLRFQIPALLKAMRVRAPAIDLRQVEVKVSPFQAAGESPHRQIVLSSASAALLRDVAETVSDPNLRLSLLRLAKRGA